jgi:2-methylcitrate dehydratase PrpD
MASISQEIVDWAWSLEPESVPADVKRIVCEHALDGLGNAIAAVRLGEAPYAHSVAALLDGPEEASVIGGGRTGAASAAVANGILIHALDFDDTHPDALVHPTAVVVPTALAAAERAGLSGSEVLAAMLAGYELVIRLGAAVRHGFHAHGFHATSVCGALASSLVAARLLGLDRVRAVNAMGIAGSFASGSLEFLSDGSSTKQVHPGWASHGGIVAAFLAGAGASGPATIIEGDAGLFRMFAGAHVQARDVTRMLGERWMLTDTMIKPYPACQLSHASLNALARLRPRLGDLSAIRSITFDIPDESVPIVCEPVEAKLHPRTPYEAKFSLQWCAATLLVDGAIGLETFEASRIASNDVLGVAAKVAYRPYKAGVAAANAGGRVEVEMTNGVERAEAPAGASHTPAMVDEKLALNVGEGSTAEELARLVRGLEKQANLDSLGRSIRGTPLHVSR